MVVLVQKYGGGSLTDLAKLEIVARKVKKYVQAGYQMVLVLSALSGETDRLIGLANLFNKDCPRREYDALLATGEQAAVCLMVMALSRLGVRAQSMNAWQAGIRGDSRYSRSAIESIDVAPIQQCIDSGVVPVVTGFQALADDLSVTTLGRGGSDTTAVALAAALDVDECQIYVDVQGVYTADPKVEPSARLIHRMPIEQMLLYANLGGKVIQKRAVACAAKYQVPLRICPTFNEGPGTVMEYNTDTVIEKVSVTAISHVQEQVLVRIDGMKSLVEDVMPLCELLSKDGCDTEHRLNQVSSGFQFDCIMGQDDHQLLASYFDAWSRARDGHTISVTKNLTRVSIIGFSLVKDVTITQSVLSCFQELGIAIRYLLASDNHFSVVIDQDFMEIALRTMHKHFALDSRQKTAPLLASTHIS